MSDELLKQLETGHDKECAMSYGMHEHCCDCSYVVRQEAAVRIRELEARVRELEGELEQKAETVMAFDDVLVSAMQKSLRELEAERDTFYMDYRMEADVDSKAALVRAERAEAERDKAEHETGKAYIERDALRALLREARESWIKVGYGASHEDVVECHDFCKRIDAALTGRL